jgi:branched-chain amino acid transport system substrate-binding protein
MEKIAVPALDALGVKHGKTVYYPDAATTPDIVSAVQAAGGSSSDAIFFDPSGPQQCTSLFNALKQLGISKPVITTPICNAPSFVDSTGKGPENWRIWGFGPSPRETGDPEVQTFNNIMDAYGQSESKNIGFAPQTVRDILTIAWAGNQLGPDKLTPAGFESEIKKFPGPAFMVPGPMHCAKPLDPKNQPGLCGEEAAGSVFKDGTWQSLGAIKNPAPPA